MNEKNIEKSKTNKILFRTVGILLIAFLLMLCALGGIVAKYVSSNNTNGQAGIAKTGVVTFELKEHEAKYDETTGLYRLVDGSKAGETASEKSGNTYDNVLPGVDIPKDPFVRMELKDSEVNFKLYVRITESLDWPMYSVTPDGESESESKRSVTYELESDWKQVGDPVEDAKAKTKTYTYVYEPTDSFAFVAGASHKYGVAGGNDAIKILKDNKLIVSHRYQGESFTLTFEAELKQATNK